MLIGISAVELGNNVGLHSELDKYKEEIKEFENAILNDDDENAIEEFYDVI